MAQQTAVEWLVEQFPQIDLGDPYNRNILQEAKHMEKEQIMKAFSDGQETPINHPTLPHYSREEYYSQTYNI